MFVSLLDCILVKFIEKFPISKHIRPEENTAAYHRHRTPDNKKNEHTCLKQLRCHIEVFSEYICYLKHV